MKKWTKFWFMGVLFLATTGLVLSALLSACDDSLSEGSRDEPTLAAADGVATTEEAHERIREALLQPVTLEFEETPLAEVINSLGDMFNAPIPILIDEAKFHESGLDRNLPITFRVADISGRSALRLLLEKHGLGYVLRDEVLMITSLDDSRSFCVTRVYPVNDLVREDVTPVADADSDPFGPADMNNTPATGGFDGRGGTAGLSHVKTDQLVDLLLKSVAPDSWNENGGKGTVESFDGRLVVYQDEQTHEKVASLLKRLRQARK